ncbi:hypothetical protein ACFQ0Q_38135 [Streptomyces aureus]
MDGERSQRSLQTPDAVGTVVGLLLQFGLCCCRHDLRQRLARFAGAPLPQPPEGERAGQG